MEPTPLERVGGGTLASKARAEILRGILQGRFEAGRIPPESDLAEMLGVSRTTVRAALQVLEHDGIVDRTPGRGTVVRLPEDPLSLSLQRLVGFSTMLRQSGKDAEVDVEWSTTTAPSEVAVRRLGIETDQACHVARRTFRSGGVIGIMLEDVIPETSLRAPPSITDGYSESLFEFAEKQCWKPIHSARVEFIPNHADARIAELFEVERGSPYLMLYETHISRNEDPIVFTRIHVNDQFVRFYVTRHH